MQQSMQLVTTDSLSQLPIQRSVMSERDSPGMLSFLLIKKGMVFQSDQVIWGITVSKS